VPRTLGDLALALTPGQLWSVGLAVAGLLSASFALGQQYVILTADPRVSEAAVVPCSKATGWPTGRWWTWGNLRTWDPKATTLVQIGEGVTLETTSSGVMLTDEQRQKGSGGVASVRLDRALQPGEPVVITVQDDTGYTATSRLTVATDGCLLKGLFSDTNGNTGNINFLWDRPEYFVQRDMR
jgi:hypothetical protein